MLRMDKDPTEQPEIDPELEDYLPYRRPIRVDGILLFFLGVFLIYLSIIRPRMQIMNHEHFWRCPRTLVFLDPVFLAFGLAYIIGGKRAVRYLGTIFEPRRPGVLLWTVCLLCGILLYIWQRRWLVHHGFPSLFWGI
jgi:hypothetical protein